MLVDEVGDITITNDGATILKQLEAGGRAAAGVKLAFVRLLTRLRCLGSHKQLYMYFMT